MNMENPNRAKFIHWELNLAAELLGFAIQNFPAMFFFNFFLLFV